MIAPKSYKERLSYLFHVNPRYAGEILECINNNPEFF